MRWVVCFTIHRWSDWEQPTFLSANLRWQWCRRCQTWR
jgi:hypothetical protein